MAVRRIVLLVTSPRLPAGLLTAQAWDLVRAHPVFAATDSDLTATLRSQGADVTVVPAQVEPILDAVARHGTVVWLGGPAGDESLARELGLRLARAPALAELELMYGSWDPPGARLLDVVTVMDRLVSPGGDPWKREQTHQTLGRYLLEEAYEAYDAIEAHDLEALREELGDVLLQVVLHARMAQDADPAWSVDDLAGDLVDKLIRRNPHVFGGADQRSNSGGADQRDNSGDERLTEVDEIVENWERIKREEKSRGSAMDGIALSQPALALAAKVLSRAQRAAIVVPEPAADETGGTDPEEALGAALLALVSQALANGLDAEAALRRAALKRAQAVRATEAG